VPHAELGQRADKDYSELHDLYEEAQARIKELENVIKGKTFYCVGCAGEVETLRARIKELEEALKAEIVYRDQRIRECDELRKELARWKRAVSDERAMSSVKGQDMNATIVWAIFRDNLFIRAEATRKDGADTAGLMGGEFCEALLIDPAEHVQLQAEIEKWKRGMLMWQDAAVQEMLKARAAESRVEELKAALEGLQE